LTFGACEGCLFESLEKEDSVDFTILDVSDYDPPACLRATHRQACAVKDMEGAYQKGLGG